MIEDNFLIFPRALTSVRCVRCVSMTFRFANACLQLAQLVVAQNLQGRVAVPTPLCHLHEIKMGVLLV